jgi:hypothetical protein
MSLYPKLNVQRDRPDDIQDFKDVNKDTLTTAGKWVSANTAIMMIARAVLVAFSIAYIVGGTDWIIIGWFIPYAILFGINFFVLAGVCIQSYSMEKKPQVLGRFIYSWNPLRKLYALTFISTVDYVTNVTIWSIWLHNNNIFVTHPQTGTPVINSSTYFSFQSMCGAFIFSSCIYIVYAFQFMRSIWNQKQSVVLHPEIDGPIKQEVGVSVSQYVMGQLTANRKGLINIDVSRGSKNVDPKGDWRVTAYLVFGGVFFVALYMVLFIFFYHTFYAQSKMRFVIEFAFYWIAFGAFIIMCGFYYIGGGSVREKILETDTNSNRNTAETNWELDNEMVSLHLFGALVLFFNLIFFIDGITMTGINTIDWKSVPKYNTAILVQSQYFYVWVTQAALNTGALCFMVYYTVNFFFTGAWNAGYDDGDSPAVVQPEVPPPQNSVVVAKGKPAAVAVIGVTAGLLVVWAVFYGFILSAMMGFHFLPKYIYPITITFAVVFFVGVVIAIGMSFLRMNEVDGDARPTGRLKQMFNINMDWYLSTYRNLIAIPFTYVVQVIIMSVTTHDFFKAELINDPSCINPPSGAPPYNPCSAYWSVAVLSMYVTSLVYMVCIVNAFSNLSTKILVYAAAKKALSKGAQ